MPIVKVTPPNCETSGRTPMAFPSKCNAIDVSPPRAQLAMRRFVQGLLYCGFLLDPTVCAAAALPASIPAVEDVEEAALATRRRIHSGDVTLTISGFAFDEEIRYQATIRFEPDRFRSDVTTRYVTRPKLATSDTYVRSRIYTPELHMRYCTEIRDDAVYEFTIDERPGIDRLFWGGIPDPRSLGMTPFHSCPGENLHIESFINGPNRENVRMAAGEWEGEPCWVISFRNTVLGFDVSAWVAPAMDHNVVHMEAEWEAEGVKYVDQSSSRVVQHGPTGLWYPAHFEYSRDEDGRRTMQENVDVEVRSWNEPIDPALLTRQSIHVPAGTIVSLLGVRGEFEWDGDKVVPRDYFPKSAIAEVRDSSRLRWILMAVNGALLGLFCFWWANRGRRKSA